MKFLKILLILMVVPTLAWAHAHMLSPPPRNSLANKVGPCGVAKTANPTTVAPGSQLTLQWSETIDHPGYYIISLAPDLGPGNPDPLQSAFDAGVIIASFPDVQGGQLPHIYQTTITLPTTPCESCTLQMIQVMTENPSMPSNYYSCVDLRISNSPPTSPPGSSNPSDCD